MDVNEETALKEVISEQPLKEIMNFLQHKDGKGLKKFVLDRKLSDETIYWEVCSEVCHHITEHNCINNNILFEACEMCLRYMVTEGNPKELLLALLEQCEFFDDDIRFTTLMFLIQKTLLRLPNKRFHSLDLALETLTGHILSKPIPEDNALENEERKLLAMDGRVQQINDVLKAFLDFLKPFVEEVSLKNSCNLHNENIQAQILVLKIHLLKILNQPVIYLDLHVESDSYVGKSDSRVCVEKLMNLFSHLETNFQKMMEFAVNKKPLIIKLDENFRKTEMEIENEENERRLNKKAKKNSAKVPSLRFSEIIPTHSLCCLSYLIHSEQLGTDQLPCVYSKSYLFEFNLPFIVDMLKTTKSLLLFKGLKLLKSFVGILPSDSISGYRLDNDNYSKVINNLIEIMIRCSMKDLRQEAVQLFTGLIKLFQHNGRYQLYQNILNKCSHSGVKGYVINLIKDEIKDTLKENIPNKSFLGQRLKRLIKIATTLPDKETTDLLEHSDRIITVLNLLRYLVIRDPPKQNTTGIWEELKNMEIDFLKPLRVGLDMSKAHYNLELQKFTDEKKKKKMVPDFDVSVGGVHLPPVTENQEIQVMHSALNTFDMIDSLLTRLTEIIEQQTI
ncbi:glomulin isoform X1 [Patella vulgata]|uniref:glomulin isoform X1 n=1 Tax=Patella vulgata TaxID=6465 RepID=UPI00217F7F77|nr:glomulin isoform X1 [Patella vulgata]